jgi:hypothetical protein
MILRTSSTCGITQVETPIKRREEQTHPLKLRRDEEHCHDITY